MVSPATAIDVLNIICCFCQIFKAWHGYPSLSCISAFGYCDVELFCRNDHAESRVNSRKGGSYRKIRIPRWIIVSSTSFSALINLVLNLIVVGVFMIINHVSLGGSAIWFPLILLEIYVFALGLSLFLSATYVKFRDISYIWEVLLQAGFYLTPIIMPYHALPILHFKN